MYCRLEKDMRRKVYKILNSAQIQIAVLVTTFLGLLAQVADGELRCILGFDSGVSCGKYESQNIVKVIFFAFVSLLFLCVLLKLLIDAFLDSPKLREKETTIQRVAPVSPNEKGADLFPLCDNLRQLIIDNESIILNAQRTKSDFNKLIQVFNYSILKIYFFGPQSAGKSSLVNALLGEKLSPTSFGKMTTCLLRIQSGEKPSFVENYDNGSSDPRPIGLLRQRMEDLSAQGPEAFNLYDITIGVKSEFLRKYNVEFVDSPGTGSSIWDEKYKYSLEDEIVNSQLGSAALVVLVYRCSDAQKEAYERIVRELGRTKATTVAVCNLDHSWAGAMRQDRKDIQAVMNRAEALIRKKTNAKCYRIAIETSDSDLVALANKEYSQSIEDLKVCIIEKLKNHKQHVIRQTVYEGKELINRLLTDRRVIISNGISH